MARIKKELLEHELARINSYSRNHYSLYCAYGGVMLVRDCENGGAAEVSIRMTTTEMYHLLYAMNTYLNMERR